MIIRTAQEQNAANCCGCDVPECADPREVCESASVSVCSFAPDVDAPVVHSDPDEGDVIYQTMNYLWAGSGTDTLTATTASDDLTLSYAEGKVAGGACPVGVVLDYDDNSKTWFEPAKTNLETDETNEANATGTDTGAGITGSQRNFGSVYDISGTELSSWDTADPYTYNYTSPPAVESGGGTSWAGPVLTYDAIGHYAAIDSATCVLTFSAAYTPATAAAAMNAVSPADVDFSGESCASELAVTYAADSVRLTAAIGTKARFKVGVPAAYDRSVWEMTWDYVQAPAAWWAWFDGGMTGSEPTPGPALVSSDSWTWGGSMATEADQFSDWKTIPIPTIPGECRAVNVLVKCYHSTRLGVKPTAVGDQIAIPE